MEGMLDAGYWIEGMLDSRFCSSASLTMTKVFFLGGFFWISGCFKNLLFSPITDNQLLVFPVASGFLPVAAGGVMNHRPACRQAG